VHRRSASHDPPQLPSRAQRIEELVMLDRGWGKTEARKSVLREISRSVSQGPLSRGNRPTALASAIASVSPDVA